ncbi:MAG TPA: sulfurtransferase TusA family protein [Rhizomicrobium sp.]|nr:sulfurtransferase TusA family protein [Rhizomicrobium sp.]
MEPILLDLKGLKCPMPALLARRALARARAGDVFEIVCDDPLAPVDVPHMCHQEGFEVLAMERNALVTRLLLRRPV